MKVLVLPTKEEQGSGVSCSIHWNSPLFEQAAQIMFDVRPDEEIESIEILPEGMVARLVGKMPTPKAPAK